MPGLSSVSPLKRFEQWPKKEVVKNVHYNLLSDSRGGVGQETLHISNGDTTEDLGDTDTILGGAQSQSGHCSVIAPGVLGEGA